MKYIIILIIAFIILFFSIHPVEAKIKSTCTYNNAALFKMVNKLRANNKLPPLFYNTSLSSSAAAKLKDMRAKGYWAHCAPKGGLCYYDFITAVPAGNEVGENLARDFGCDSQILNGFINSPTHLANLLDKNYDSIGIARSGVFVAVHFGDIR